MASTDTDPTFDPSRFRRAQDRDESFATAMAELQAGRKRSHWIWWVFPQIEGLGASPTSRRFALAGRGEACAYVADDVLRERLIEAVDVVCARLRGPTRSRLEVLMGSQIDAYKLVSSMTLFEEIAKDPTVRGLPGVPHLGASASEILQVALGDGYPACAHTRASL